MGVILLIVVALLSPAVHAAVQITNLSLNPNQVTGGDSSTGTVTLDGAAPGGGALISLSSSNAAAIVPGSVTVAAGSTSATFTVSTTVPCTRVSATIIATLGSSSQNASFTVNAPGGNTVVSTVTLSPSQVVGGDSATGTVTLNHTVPCAAGVTVSLRSSNAVVQVPASVSMASGDVSATFTATTSAVTRQTDVDITATLSADVQARLTVNPQTAVVSVNNVSLSPNQVTGGSSTTGTVTLDGAAPSGGSLVGLTSNDPAATVPSTVTVAAGNRSATFSVTTTIPCIRVSATITATLGISSQSASLTINAPGGDIAVTAVTLSPTQVVGGASVTGTVTLNHAVPCSGAVVTLSSNNASVQVPASLTIPNGSNSAGFNASTSAVTIRTDVKVTATLGGSVDATVTLLAPSAPVISLNPSALSFSAVQGGGNPSVQTASVSNSGTGILNWTAIARTTAGGNWLVVSPNSGTGSGTLAVSVNISGLAAATYLGVVTVAAEGATNTPQVINVSLSISGAGVRMAVAPATLSFSAQQNGGNPSPQTLRVTSSDGSTVLAWSAGAATTDAANWLSVAPAAGSTPGSIAVSVNAAGLLGGTYQGSVTVQPAASGLTVAVPVTLTVAAAHPEIGTEPSALSFQVQTGAASPPPQTVVIASSTGSSISWAAHIATSSGGNWLAVSAASGVAPSMVSVTANTAGLPQGTYVGSIILTSPEDPDSPESVGVTLAVTAAAPIQIAVQPATLSFEKEAGAGDPAPQTVLISNTGGSSLRWNGTTSTTSGGSWLSISPATGSTPASTAVRVDMTGLLAGSYQGAVTFEIAGVGKQTVAVSLRVQGTGAQDLTVEPLILDFEVPEGKGNPQARAIRVGNGGAGMLDWTLQPSVPWLVPAATSGTVSAASPVIVPITANAAALSAGVYSGTLRVASAAIGDSHTVRATLRVARVSRSILLSQSGLSFTGVEGGSAVPSQSFGVLNVGDGPMNWSAGVETLSGGNWLQVSPAGGTSVAKDLKVPLVDVFVDVGGLAAGLYHGSVHVNGPGADNSPQTVTVDLTVLPRGSNPPVVVRPTGLILAAPSGSSTPVLGSVTLRTATPGNVKASSVPGTVEGGSWLDSAPRNVTVSPASPQTVTIQALPAGLPPGIYRGGLLFLFSDSTPLQPVNILLQVLPAGTSTDSAEEKGVPRANAPNCIPRRMSMVGNTLDLDLATPVGWPRNIEVTLRDDCGNPIPNAQNPAMATVVASFSNGDSPAMLDHVGNGIYHGNWMPAHPDAQVTVKVLALFPGSTPLAGVELTFKASVAAGSSIPVIAPGGIVSAASYSAGTPLAPGDIIAVFGQNLSTGAAQSQSVPLPTSLSGATLQIGELNAPLFYASSGQVNAQIPFELPLDSRPQARLRVRQGATESLSVPQAITLTSANPAIFTVDGSGKGQGHVYSVANILVNSSAPAKAGDFVVLYCSGLGLTDPAATTGNAAPNAPLARVVITVTARIGGKDSPVAFAGLSPGLVGLYQVNVQIPAGVPTGSAIELVLTQNGRASNAVTLAIQP